MNWQKLILNEHQITTTEQRYVADRFMAEYNHLLGPKGFTLLLGKQRQSIYFSPTAASHCKAFIESYSNEESARPELGEIEECYGDCSGYGAQSQRT